MLIALERLSHGLFDFLSVRIGQGFHAPGAFQDFQLCHVHLDRDGRLGGRAVWHAHVTVPDRGLKEEVVVRREAVDREEQVRDTVRRDEIAVEDASEAKRDSPRRKKAG